MTLRMVMILTLKAFISDSKSAIDSLWIYRNAMRTCFWEWTRSLEGGRKVLNLVSRENENLFLFVMCKLERHAVMILTWKLLWHPIAELLSQRMWNNNFVPASFVKFSIVHCRNLFLIINYTNILWGFRKC